jgi:RHS repeat-associated protein
MIYGARSQGLTAGSFTPDFGFAGMCFHERSGLNLKWFRDYNPQLGRWLSRDPIGEAGGLNLYGYVGGNPITFVDPAGLAPSTGVIARNPCNGQQFRLQPDRLSNHIEPRHFPNVMGLPIAPTGNTVPRGVFSAEVWNDPRLINQAVQSTLGGNNPRVSHSHDPATGYDVYEQGLMVQSHVNGVPSGPPRPIGTVYGPGGISAQGAAGIRIIVDPASNNIVTMYPISSAPSGVSPGDVAPTGSGTALVDSWGTFIRQLIWAP